MNLRTRAASALVLAVMAGCGPKKGSALRDFLGNSTVDVPANSYDIVLAEQTKGAPDGYELRVVVSGYPDLRGSFLPDMGDSSRPDVISAKTCTVDVYDSSDRLNIPSVVLPTDMSIASKLNSEYCGNLSRNDSVILQSTGTKYSVAH